MNAIEKMKYELDTLAAVVSAATALTTGPHGECRVCRAQECLATCPNRMLRVILKEVAR